MKVLRPLFVLASLGLGWLSFGAPAEAADPPPVAKGGVLPTKECGVGACKRTVPAVAVCKPGDPITEDEGWLMKPDVKTGSWDANCDGTVEKKTYPEFAYVSGCESEEPGPKGCVSARVTEPACGQHWSIRSCQMLKTPKGAKCLAPQLQGAVTQACR